VPVDLFLILPHVPVTALNVTGADQLVDRHSGARTRTSGRKLRSTPE